MTLDEALELEKQDTFPYFDWSPGDDIAIVDGWCSLEQLEAMIVIMKETKDNG